jgi:Tfp pilus assembly protein PilF
MSLSHQSSWLFPANSCETERMITGSLFRVFTFICGAFALFTANAQTTVDPRIEMHRRQAQKYLESKEPAPAMKEFGAILAIDPNNLDANGNLGVLEFFQSEYAHSAPHLRAALKINPSLWKLRALLGMSEKRMGEFARAQSDLEAAFPHLNERKLQIQAGLELIEADYTLRDLAKAAQTVNTLRQIEPTNPEILFTAHRIYSQLADEAALSLAMLAPDSPRMHQIVAQELVRANKDNSAIENYRIALKMEPGWADLHYELGEVLNGQRSAAAQAEAEKEYKAAVADNPFDAKSECRLGDIALRHGDLKSAEAYYKRSIKLQPNEAETSFGLAKVMMSQQRPKDALPLLQRAVELDPFDPLSRYRLAGLYRELGRMEDSRKEMTEFEKLKKMKSQLSDLYEQLRFHPDKPEDADMPR